MLRMVPRRAGRTWILLGGGAVLMAASAPRSAELFDDWGFDVVVVDIGEFEKMEGCVTCLSGSFNPQVIGGFDGVL